MGECGCVLLVLMLVDEARTRGGRSWQRTCLGLCNIEKRSLASTMVESSETVGKESSR